MQAGKQILVLLLLLLPVASGCQAFQAQRHAISYIEPAGERPELASNSAVRPTSYHEPAPQQEAKSLGLKDLTPGKLAQRVKVSLGQGPSPEKARQLYRQAAAAFRQASAKRGKDRRPAFIDAAEKYAAAAKRWPDSALEEDALFMAGECWFFADSYPKARTAWDQLVKKYPNSRHLDTVDTRRFSVARYWHQLHEEHPQWILQPNFMDHRRPRNDTFGHAQKLYDQIRLDDPTSRLADDATVASGNAYFLIGKYNKADQYYDDLRKNFPNSEHQFQAHLLSLKTKLKLYQGPDYGSGPLTEAKELITKIHKLFPHEAEVEREFLGNAQREVRAKMAIRLWQDAQYYENRKKYGSARVYYNRILKDYGDTNLAGQARQRLENISTQPDTPPQRMAWLTEMFQSAPRQNQPLIASDWLINLRR